MACVSKHGTIPADIDRVAPPRRRRRHTVIPGKANSVGSESELAWRAVTEDPMLFEVPIAGIELSSCMANGLLRHCSGTSWWIHRDAIDFEAAGYRFTKPPGNHPLVVTWKFANRIEFRLHDGTLQFAEVSRV